MPNGTYNINGSKNKDKGKLLRSNVSYALRQSYPLSNPGIVHGHY
jgi:hypothetical protein